jgi:transcriptional regulator with XRE-family HTH domain
MKIRAFRKSRQLTLEQLGDALGVTKGYLSQIENGIEACSAPLALKLEKFSGGALNAADLNQSVAAARSVQPA